MLSLVIARNNFQENTRFTKV